MSIIQPTSRWISREEAVRRIREIKRIVQSGIVVPEDVPVVRPYLSHVCIFFRHIGLTTSDGEWFYDKLERQAWAGVSDWQATARAWKREGYFPSQKSLVKA